MLDARVHAKESELDAGASTCHEALGRQPRRESGSGCEARRQQRGVLHLRSGRSRSMGERGCPFEVACANGGASGHPLTSGAKPIMHCAVTDMTWLVVPPISAAAVPRKQPAGPHRLPGVGGQRFATPATHGAVRWCLAQPSPNRLRMVAFELWRL